MMAGQAQQESYAYPKPPRNPRPAAEYWFNTTWSSAGAGQDSQRDEASMTKAVVFGSAAVALMIGLWTSHRSADLSITACGYGAVIEWHRGRECLFQFSQHPRALQDGLPSDPRGHYEVCGSWSIVL
uniref:Uncharacterized protein n=1 Tax=Knipowitschia caucasica TaxID=637954 RepID=A0AAV2L792_KNICA